MTTLFATPKAVFKAVGDMPAEHVHCRTLGHVWAHRTVVRVKGGGYEQTLGCRTCATTKIQQISRTGVILGSSTNYTPGYLLKGLGRLNVNTKAIVRLASLEHAVHEGELQ